MERGELCLNGLELCVGAGVPDVTPLAAAHDTLCQVEQSWIREIEASEVVVDAHLLDAGVVLELRGALGLRLGEVLGLASTNVDDGIPVDLVEDGLGDSRESSSVHCERSRVSCQCEIAGEGTALIAEE